MLIMLRSHRMEVSIRGVMRWRHDNVRVYNCGRADLRYSFCVILSLCLQGPINLSLRSDKPSPISPKPLAPPALPLPFPLLLLACDSDPAVARRIRVALAARKRRPGRQANRIVAAGV